MENLYLETERDTVRESLCKICILHSIRITGRQRLQCCSIIITRDKPLSVIVCRSAFWDILMSPTCLLTVFTFYQSILTHTHTHNEMRYQDCCKVGNLAFTTCPPLFLLYLLPFSGLTVRTWELATGNSQLVLPRGLSKKTAQVFQSVSVFWPFRSKHVDLYAAMIWV